MTAVFIAPTEIILAAFPQQQEEHIRAWRWECYRTGNYHVWPRYSNRIVYGSREAA